MIARNDDNLCLRDRGKQVIDLLQIPGQRLAVEQISRDQKKIRTAVPGILNDGLEGEADGLLPLFPRAGRCQAPSPSGCLRCE